MKKIFTLICALTAVFTTAGAQDVVFTYGGEVLEDGAEVTAQAVDWTEFGMGFMVDSNTPEVLEVKNTGASSTRVSVNVKVVEGDYARIQWCGITTQCQKMASTTETRSTTLAAGASTRLNLETEFHEGEYGVRSVLVTATANGESVSMTFHMENKEAETEELYSLQAANLKTSPGKQITLSLNLKNFALISDYQFDLCIPKGFSIAKDEDDLEMIYLSIERTTERKHTYSYNMLTDSVLRVISYSDSTYTFSGNEGEVLTITLDVAEDVADGDYTLLIKNIEMTEPDGTTHKASDYPCKVTIISYTPGDINNDGSFSVTDVRGIVNMVLAAQSPDDNLAADVNEDGVLSVTDVRGVVNLVLNPVTPTAMLSPKMRAATSSTNLLYIEPFTITPGEEKEVLVMLNNPGEAFSDIQYDLYLPDGIEVVKDEIGYWIDLGSRTTDRKHNLPEAALQRDGAVRVLCYSDNTETFFGHSGDVMKITLKASDNLPAGLYDLELKNVELARPDMTNDRLQTSTASVSVNGNTMGIGSFATEAEQGEIFDLNGRQVVLSAKGVYVINGKKIMIK